MDHAMQGGIDDVGIGVLYGLEHYKYDFVGLLMHAEHLGLYMAWVHILFLYLVFVPLMISM